MTKPKAWPNMLAEPRDIPERILISETIDKFGYDPRHLKPNSFKIVCSVCPECNKVQEKKFQSAIKQPLCLNCSNRINAQKSIPKRSQRMKDFYANGGKHPLQGIGHSAETRARMGKNRIGIPANLSEAGRRSLVENCMKTLNNPERKKKTAAMNRLRRGPFSPSYGKPPAHAKKVWYIRTDGSRVCFRSTWEFAFARWLDLNGVDWTYEPQAIPVTYQIDDSVIDGTYTPDFVVGDFVFEVKGRWTKEGLAKFEAFKKQAAGNSRVYLIDRDAMNKLGLLPVKGLP